MPEYIKRKWRESSLFLRGLFLGALALGTGIAIAVWATEEDTDEDGMLDVWEFTFFGNLEQTAGGDFDQDGLSNLAEFQLGTDPTARDTDRDQWNEPMDAAPLSRAYVLWGAPRFTLDDEYDYPGPLWWLGAFKTGGEWATNGPAWHVPGDAIGEPGVYLKLDRGALASDLRMDLTFLDHALASLYVDLLDPSNALVAADLYGNLLTGSDQPQVLSLSVPLEQYPSASVIGLRRGLGEVTLYETHLYIDKDGDGLDAAQELQLGTSDQQSDTDGDGLGDYAEAFVHHTNPALADTDGDGLSDYAEVAVHQTNPILADTDGDGINDGREIAYGLDPKVAGTYTALPFHEFFEPDTVGSGALNGMNGWTASPADGASLQTAVVYEGAQALRIKTISADRTAVEHLFASPAGTEATVELCVQALGTEPPADPVSGTVAMFFDLTGHLVIRDGAQWRTLSEQPAVPSGAWVRLGFTMDYAQQKWRVSLDGNLVAQNLAFANAASAFNRVRLVAERAFVDELHVRGGVDPADLDGDGLADAWETSCFGDLSPTPGGDPDGDGLTNVREQALGTHPANRDTDGDGMSDGVEVGYGFSPTQDNGYSRAPFIDDFETAQLGLLNGQNGWEVEPAAGAVVQASTVFEGAQAVALGTPNVEAEARLFVGASGESLVWVDLMVQARGHTRPTGTVKTAALYFDGSRHPVVFDGTVGDWVTITTHPPIAAGEWVQVAMRLDYATRKWDLWIKAQPVAQNLGFAGPSREFSRLRIEAEQTCVDRVRVGSVSPSLEDGDQLPNDWEIQYFGNLDQTETGDPDGDGLSNLAEYQAGTDPTKADTDDDGMADGWEVTYGLNALVDDAALDLDGDGFANIYEYAQGSAPNNGQSLPTPSVFVDAAAAPGGNGSQASPFKYIQAALDAAPAQAIIQVAAGLYSGLGNRDLDFFGKTVMLVSANGPETCIIDCARNAQNPGRGFFFHSGETPLAVIEGFTIRGGFASAGAGIYCVGASPTIRHCVIRENTADPSVYGQGGGIRVTGATPVIEDCAITANVADTGAGVSCEGDASPVIRRCTIVGNSGSFDGAGIHCYWQCSPLIEDCTIAGNYSAAGGGGLHCAWSSSPTVRRTVIRGNSALTGGGIVNRGASAPVMESCIVAGNQSSADWAQAGGIVCYEDADTILMNCTVADNTAPGPVGGIWSYASAPALTNTIVWGNSGAQLSAEIADVSYSCVQGGWAGQGNLSDDPKLAPGTWHLLPDSPCVDAGTVVGAPEFDVDGEGRVGAPDIGADEMSEAYDGDGDGMADGWEMLYFGTLDMGPDADYDMDGLSNIEEYQSHSLPNQWDADHDWLPDGWEYAHNLSVLPSEGSGEADTDVDADWLSNLDEVIYCGDPSLGDTDGDFASDNQEATGGTYVNSNMDPAGDPVQVTLYVADDHPWPDFTDRYSLNIAGPMVGEILRHQGAMSWEGGEATYNQFRKNETYMARIQHIGNISGMQGDPAQYRYRADVRVDVSRYYLNKGPDWNRIMRQFSSDPLPTCWDSAASLGLPRAPGYISREITSFSIMPIEELLTWGICGSDAETSVHWPETTYVLLGDAQMAPKAQLHVTVANIPGDFLQERDLQARLVFADDTQTQNSRGENAVTWGITADNPNPDMTVDVWRTWTDRNRTETATMQLYCSPRGANDWRLVASSTITLVPVKIDRLQYRKSDGSFADMPTPEPLKVIEGSSITFRALPRPADMNWPANRPTWEIWTDGMGTPCGLGEEVTITFGPLSLNPERHLRLKAECYGPEENDVDVVPVVVDLDGLEPGDVYVDDEQDVDPGIKLVSGQTHLVIPRPWPEDAVGQGGEFTLEWQNPSAEKWIQVEGQGPGMKVSGDGEWPNGQRRLVVTCSTDWEDWADTTSVTLSHSVGQDTDHVTLGLLPKVDIVFFQEESGFPGFGTESGKKWMIATLPRTFETPLRLSARLYAPIATAPAALRFKRGNNEEIDVAWAVTPTTLQFEEGWLNVEIEVVDGDTVLPTIVSAEDGLLTLAGVAQGDQIIVTETTLGLTDHTAVIKNFTWNDLQRLGANNLTMHPDHGALPAPLKANILATIRFCLDQRPDCPQAIQREAMQDIYGQAGLAVLDIPSARGVGIMPEDMYHAHFCSSARLLEPLQQAVLRLDDFVDAKANELEIDAMWTDCRDAGERSKYVTHFLACLANLNGVLSQASETDQPFLVYHTYEMIAPEYLPGDNPIDPDDPIRNIRCPFAGDPVLFYWDGPLYTMPDTFEVLDFNFIVDKRGRVMLYRAFGVFGRNYERGILIGDALDEY